MSLGRTLSLVHEYGLAGLPLRCHNAPHESEGVDGNGEGLGVGLPVGIVSAFPHLVGSHDCLEDFDPFFVLLLFFPLESHDCLEDLVEVRLFSRCLEPRRFSSQNTG